ncbi:MAG: ABC transporter ATP-binding protein [Gemmatimonadetes bacterium]|nr:ABC transporter ATP-binding protein [Gemmatimonadota bacterium]
MSRENGVVIGGHGLRRSHGPRTVLQVDEIEIRRGELLAIFGPNGAGKSTLLRILAMLEKPSAGAVSFEGRSGAAAEKALRIASAVVFQRAHFWRENVEYNVGLGLRLRGRSRSETRRRVHRVCEQLGIEPLLGVQVTDISGGEAQRVALARALVLDPQVLFLDEPTSNLDTDSRAELRGDLERVARERATSILLITHDRNEAFHLADRVGVLRGGRLIQIGTPTEIYENPVDVYTARLTGAEFILQGRVVDRDERTLTVDVGGASVRALGEARLDEPVKIAYRPEDLVLGPPDQTPGELSTRNLIYATITERRDMGGLVRLRMQGPAEMVALVTRDAADELGASPGARVSVRAKATALHAFPTVERASQRSDRSASSRRPEARSVSSVTIGRSSGSGSDHSSASRS